MYLGSVLGLIAALAAAPAFAAPRAVEVGLYVWHEDLEDFGGLSALELSPDGADFVAVSSGETADPRIPSSAVAISARMAAHVG